MVVPSINPTGRCLELQNDCMEICYLKGERTHVQTHIHTRINVNIHIYACACIHGKMDTPTPRIHTQTYHNVKHVTVANVCPFCVHDRIGGSGDVEPRWDRYLTNRAIS